ncbi:hypothetical protein GCM10018952_20420 [Streptosporangium vulgare]
MAAAKALPPSESPAWMVSGRPCGLRGTVKWPPMSKWVPRWANSPASRLANVPADGSATRSSAAQESQSSLTVRTNSSARS